MHRLSLIALVAVSFVTWLPVSAQEETPSASTSMIEAGQKIEGPIQVTDSIAIMYYYLGETSTGTTPSRTWLVAEVENTSNVSATTPWNFQAQGLDENGVPYGDSSYLASFPIVLAPGERTVIWGEIGSGLPPESFSSVAFTATDPDPSYAPLPVVIEGIQASGKTKDVARKQGEIRNTGDTVIDIDIMVIWYAPDGTVLGSCWGTTGGSIPPGKTLPIQTIERLGGCLNVTQGAELLGVSASDDTGYAIQIYSLA